MDAMMKTVSDQIVYFLIVSHTILSFCIMFFAGG